MHLVKKKVELLEAREILVKNDTRIAQLRDTAAASTAESEAELAARVELDGKLRAHFMQEKIPELCKIVVDFPQAYKTHTTAKTYFEAAYSTITAECANLGYACVYGCTLDFSHIYTIYVGKEKIPVMVVSRCEIIVLPLREEPGRDFVQEISEAWECEMKQRFGIEPEDFLSMDLQMRIEREMLQGINDIKDRCEVSEKDEIFASILNLFDSCLESTARLAGERADFPELYQTASNLVEELQRRNQVLDVREKIFEDLQLENAADREEPDAAELTDAEEYDLADDD